MKEKSLKKRIKEGQIQRDDVVRRLAELAFGRANDCIKLVMSSDPPMDKLDLSLLSEVTAPGRCQALYFIFRFRKALCFC